MADSEVLAWASAPAATQVAMPDGALILDFFERTASEHPASTALVWLESLSGPETSVSYAALDADANKLANHLINVLGLRTGDIVLQFCDKGVPMVVAILATLKAGATYVPLDPEHPAGRTRAIQAASSATLCLTTSDLRSNLVARLPDAVLLDVDVFVRNAPAIDYKPVPLPARPGHDDLCYIMFTSGSTGVPKGVCIPHRAVVSSIINGPPHNQLLRGKGQALRVLQFSNYAFDVSVWDMWLPLTSGGTLCLAPKLVMLEDLAGVMNALRISFLETTPTVLSLLDPRAVPTLQTVYTAGEALTAHVRARFLPSAVGRLGYVFANAGGPTETTVMSVFAPLEDGDDPRAFGRPFGANRLYVLDPLTRAPVPPGAPGVLYIGGAQLARGYLGAADATARVFMPDPFVDSGARMYDTGDLCSWKDGMLLYHGRADAQVKVRGQRIETGEVEAALVGATCSRVRAACVVKRVLHGREELVGFVDVEDPEEQELADVLVEIAAKLTKNMIPAQLIPLRPFPVTQSGKTDRKALETLALDFAANGELPAPVSTESLTPTEDAVRAAWAHALATTHTAIGPDMDFYALGGDSISAIRAAAAARAAGLALTLGDFSSAPTVRAQARLVAARTAVEEETPYAPFALLSSDRHALVLAEAAHHGYTETDVEDAYPSTPSVSGLVALAVANTRSYFAQYTFQSNYLLDATRLRGAWAAVISRHPVLRTLFLAVPDIVQVVLKPERMDTHWVRLEFPHASARDAAVSKHLAQAPGFVLGAPPLRLALFDTPDSSVLVWEMHHAQYDGWSFPLFLADLTAAYEGAVLPAPPVPLAHHVRWITQQDVGAARNFWATALEGAVPLGWPKVPQTTTHAKTATNTSMEHTWAAGATLAAFCAAQRVTISDLIRTAVSVVLGVHGSSDDVLFGVVTSGRTGNCRGIENIAGSLMTTLPCRVRLPSGATYLDVMRSVHSQAAATSPYEFLGLNDIIRAGSFVGLQDIFNVLLTIENLPGLHETTHPLLGRNLRGHWLEMNYPLALTVFPSEDRSELRLHFQWDSRYLAHADVDWFKSHLLAVCTAIMADPEGVISERDLLSHEEEEYVREVGIGLSPAPELAARAFLHDAIDIAAAAHAAVNAVEYARGNSITYEALIRLTNQVAHGLQKHGIGPERTVPVLFDKNADQLEAVVAMLATMKAGGAFIPLDSAWPAGRLASCIRQTNSTFVLCDTNHPEVALEMKVPILTVAELADGQPATTPVTPDLRSESLAYIMFTSGSTGEPKGVMIEHRNMLAYVANAATIFPFPVAKRMLHFSPWTFDQGLADMLFAFSYGATLLLANMEDMLTDMSAVLNGTRADYATMTPALAGLIRTDVDHPHLKTLVCGGEKLPAQLIPRWRGKINFIDAYGPTEVTVHCISNSFSAEVKPIPGVIGRPLGDLRAYIVDSSMRLLPVAAVGELVVAGSQVGRGYLNLPEKTAEVFHPNPFHPGQMLYKTGDLARWTCDGQIEYLGRQDGGFIKIRGLRVDVGEVEAVLMTETNTIAVVQLVVLEGQEHLLAFISSTLAPSGEVSVALVADPEACQPWVKKLVRACKSALPSYATPSLWLALDAIPQAHSNKFDRKQLRRFYDQISAEPGKVEAISRVLRFAQPPRMPETKTERQLYELWVQTLALEHTFNVHDDFFSLGGNSIGVVRVLSSLRQRGQNVTLQQFYEASTIAALAQVIDASAPGSDERPDSSAGGIAFQIHKAADADEAKQAPLWLFHAGEGIGTDYIRIPPIGRDMWAINNPSPNRFELEANYPDWDSYLAAYMPLLPSDRPVWVGGWSSGGCLALAVAKRRLALGQPVLGVILLDSFNPDGWQWLGYAPDNPFGCNDPSNAIKPGPKELAMVHLRHTNLLGASWAEPELDIPVLLIKSGIPPFGFDKEYVFPERDGDPRLSNWWRKERLSHLEVAVIEDATHNTIVGYGTPLGEYPPTCRKVSDLIRAFTVRDRH